MTKVRTCRINIDENAQQGDAIVIGANGWMTSQHLGTAASLDAGVCACNVPILDACGKLPDSTIQADAMKASVYDTCNKQLDVYDYRNFDNTPEIPVVNDPTITFTQGGATVGSISLNQSGNTTISLLAGGIGAGDGISIDNNIASVNYDNCSLCIDNCKLSIKDYNTIVSGATAGATAIQPNDLCTTCDLQNYYLKCETYKKCEVDNLISNFGGFEVVSTLPTTNIKTNVIYLLGPIGTGADKYEEWIYYNDTWTKIGETTTDLSNYAKCCDIPTDNCQLCNSCGYTTCTGTLVANDLQPYTKSCDLCTVATSGKYCDLTGTPTIPAALSSGNGISITSNCINVNYDGSTIKKNDGNCIYADLTGYVLSCSLADVATSGQYCDLTGTPELCIVATSGKYCDLTGNPSLCAVATSGKYCDLTGTPTLCAIATSGQYCDLTGTPTLCTVATSGQYCDLTGLPDLSCKQDVITLGNTLHYDSSCCLQVGDANNDLQGMRYVCASYFKTSSSNMTGTPTAIPVLDASGWICKQTPSCFLSNLGIKAVATSGCYCDLTGTPTIPTDNCQLSNSCGYTTCTGTLTDSSLKTINGCCLVGSGDICIQGGGGCGDVTGPSSSTDGNIVLFDGTTGKTIKDGCKALSDLVQTSGNQTIAGTKTFSTSPVVPSKTSSVTNTGTSIATEAQVYSVKTAVDTINGKIPSAATSSNKLADKAYVNDSINSVTAYYITKNAQGDQFATYSELQNAKKFYSCGELRDPTRNDYTIVLDDENHGNATTRYIFNKSWEYQYTVNETAMSQAQLNALNSGITSAKVSTYDGYASTKQDVANLKTSLTDNSDTYYPSQKAVKTAVDRKQDKLLAGTDISIVNPLVPDGYTQLTYLGTNGQINLGFRTTNNSRIEASWTKNKNAAKFLYQADSGSSLTTNTTAYSTTGNANWRFGNRYASIDTSALKDYLTIQDSSGVTVNGTTYAYSTVNTFTSTNYFKLLYTGDEDIIRVKYLKHYSSNTLTLHVVPAMRNSDNAYGFYDVVSDTFFTDSSLNYDVGEAVYPVISFNNGSGYALDSGVVHNTGAETVDGAKTFTSAMEIQVNADAGLNIKSNTAGGYLYVTRGSGNNAIQSEIKSVSSGGAFGTASNHALMLRTNDDTKVTVGTDGSVVLATDVASNSDNNQVATTKWTNTKLSGKGDMSYLDYSWKTLSGNSITLDLNSVITPSANFTVNKPSTIKEGQIYVLRVNSGSTTYTMTLGTGISNPWGTDLTLTPSGTDMFVFLATSSSTLELQNDVDDEVRFVTQDEYNALPATKETDGRAYFIVEEVE